MYNVETSRMSRGVIGTLVLGSLALIALLVMLVALSGGANAIVLFIPAFLAGVLSFLSPCTLPVLPAYFAWTLSLANDESADVYALQWRTLLSSVAFFAGLATTMVTLGVIITTSLRTIVMPNIDVVTKIGGVIIILLGLLSFFGKGFAGPTLHQRHSTSLVGAYLYGLTFAIGWTACIGPILGAILTMVSATGASAVAGGVLTFVYVLGLGLPLIIVATFFNRLGQGSKGWKFLRGRSWDVKLGSRTLFLHSTSMLSGILLIVVGVLLFSGKLSSLNQYSLPGGVSEWANDIQYTISEWFGIN